MQATQENRIAVNGEARKIGWQFYMEKAAAANLNARKMTFRFLDFWMFQNSALRENVFEFNVAYDSTGFLVLVKNGRVHLAG